MAATEIPLDPHLIDNETALKQYWTGSGGPYSTTGGGTFDEIAYVKVRGMNKVSINVIELLGQAGKAKYYGITKGFSSVTPAGIISGDKPGQLGDSAGVDLVASNGMVQTFEGPYEGILVCVAKTAGGAGTDHVRIEVNAC